MQNIVGSVPQVVEEFFFPCTHSVSNLCLYMVATNHMSYHDSCFRKDKKKKREKILIDALPVPLM